MYVRSKMCTWTEAIRRALELAIHEPSATAAGKVAARNPQSQPPGARCKARRGALRSASERTRMERDFWQQHRDQGRNETREPTQLLGRELSFPLS